MPYRFKLDEKIHKAFRRIAGEQVARVLRELEAESVTPIAIHTSRKALKRVRALIRCAAPALGAKPARKHDKAFRDIARCLSSRRDSDVALRTIEGLEGHFGSDAAACLKPLRGHIEARDVHASTVLDAEVLLQLRLALKDAGKRLAGAKWSGRGIANIITGMEHTYRDGRAALDKVTRAADDERIHELRKTVQAHWRHMALLSRCWPDEFAGRVSAARELSDLLGDDHDLAVLKHAAAQLPEDQAKLIADLCVRRQMQLRALVHFRARMLFAEKPAAFAERMSTYWATGCKSARAAKRAAKTAPPIANAGGLPSPVQAGSQLRLAAKSPVKVRSQPGG